MLRGQVDTVGFPQDSRIPCPDPVTTSHEIHATNSLDPISRMDTPNPVEGDSDAFEREIQISPLPHFLRVLVPIAILLILTFFMALIQVYSDMHSMDFFYGVKTHEQWLQLIKSLEQIQSNYTLQAGFPSALVSRKFGGYGDQGSFDAALFMSNIEITNSAESLEVVPEVLTINDVVFRQLERPVEDVKAIADLLCTFIFILTILFLFCLPYFDAFKTKIRRKSPKKVRIPVQTDDTVIDLETLSTSDKSDLENIDPQLALSPTPIHAASPALIPPNISVIPCPPSANLTTGHVSSGTSIIPTYTKSQSLFLFRHRYIHGLVYIRRLIMILAINYGLRAILVWMTIFPQQSFECIPMFVSNFWEGAFLAWKMVAGVDRACFDFMFSGHTSLTTICIWFWFIYSSNVLFHPRRYYIDVEPETSDNHVVERPRHPANMRPEGSSPSSLTSASTLPQNRSKNRFRKSKKFAAYQKPRRRSVLSYVLLWSIRVICVLFLAIVAAFMTVSKIHYTVDIGVGAIIGTLLFWFYHALLSLYYYFQFKSSIYDEEPEDKLLNNGPDMASSIRRREWQKQSNREIRDILVPLKTMNFVLEILGYIDGYDLYQRDNIGYAKEMRRLQLTESNDSTPSNSMLFTFDSAFR